MKTRTITVGLIVVISGVVAGIVLTRQPEQKVASMKPKPVAPALMQQPALPRPEVAPPQPALVVEAKRPPVETKPAPSPAKIQIQQPAPKPGPERVDPDARIALAFVGEDPEAEAYWEDAIFDTSLPDDEREDLMEDLNEVGLSDPKHPTAEDMQLIAARIPIIEDAALQAAGRGDLQLDSLNQIQLTKHQSRMGLGS